MASPVFKALKAWQGAKQYMNRGFWHTLGAEPLSMAKGGSSRWNWFGRGMETGMPGRLGPKFDETSHGSKLWESLWTVGQLGATGAAVVGGYAEGGVMGAATGFAWDLSVNAAMVKHGYKYSKNAANVRVMGLRGGALGMIGRYVAGSSMAMAASSAAGGGALGLGASMVGGYVGVRAAGPLLLGYAGYQAAKFTGSATMGVLKAGREHRKMQRNLHNSGSLAAFNSQGAHTMRQRAVQAIHKSHLNARSALGSEAQFMHYPSKSYNSRYRMAY